MKQFAEAADQLLRLDSVIALGWRPCVNERGNGSYHVGLRHANAGKPVMVRNDNGVHVATPQRLWIHKTNESLAVALNEAIEQALSTDTSITEEI